MLDLLLQMLVTCSGKLTWNIVCFLATYMFFLATLVYLVLLIDALLSFADSCCSIGRPSDASSRNSALEIENRLALRLPDKLKRLQEGLLQRDAGKEERSHCSMELISNQRRC